MASNLVKIETYKGVDIFYNKENSKLVFNSEGFQNECKYLFEATEIIDRPKWEVCNLEGYFIDGIFQDYIGLAKAEKKDLKSGKPFWMLKGEYDSTYKTPNSWRKTKVFPKNTQTEEIYVEWKKQHEVVETEKQKESRIVSELKKHNED